MCFQHQKTQSLEQTPTENKAVKVKIDMSEVTLVFQILDVRWKIMRSKKITQLIKNITFTSEVVKI